MGILRLYLALCVVAAHAGTILPWRMHDGQQAVQIFYIISGFYMALVLSTRYANDRDFYVSRFMRIFPAYWVVAIGTIVLSVATGLSTGQWLLLQPYVDHPLSHNGVAGIVLTGVSNLTLFGQDWALFLSHDAAQPLQFTANFRQDASPLWHYLLVPQCWSVGLELTFYVCAPFLNRARTRWLVAIALGAFALRLAAYWGMRLDYNPWTYRFFPFEIGLFLLGMLGYRLYARILQPRAATGFRHLNPPAYLGAVALLLPALYLTVRGVEVAEGIFGYELAVLISYPVWALVGVPWLFFLFGSQKADRVIGELSYPIYLLHYVVAAVLGLIPTIGGIELGLGKSSAVVSIILAGLFYRFLIAPIDRKRHSIPLTPKVAVASGPVPGNG